MSTMIDRDYITFNKIKKLSQVMWPGHVLLNKALNCSDITGYFNESANPQLTEEPALLKGPVTQPLL